MDDIHVFIILFLGLLFLCRATKEGFEPMGPGGVLLEPMKEGETAETEEEEVEEPSPPPPPPPPVPAPPQGNIGQPDSGMTGWDKRKVFSSPNAPNFGSILELQEIEYLNSLFSKRNADPNVPDVPIDSQMPSLSEGSTVPNMMGNGGTPPPPPPPPQAQGGAPLEVHMVYADWCGHSQNALPPFEELVEMTDVTTSSGRSVKFVLTEQSSDGFKEFKGKVKGFPTYMVKDGSKLEEIDVGDRSKDSVLSAVEKL